MNGLNCHNIQAFRFDAGLAMSTIHTFSSREFTRDVSAAKRAADHGPVFITDRGEPAYALLAIEDYHRLVGRASASLLDLMQGLPASGEGEFEVPRVAPTLRPADLD